MGDVQGRNNVLNRAQKYTLNQFNAEFPDDDACLEAIKEMRFPGAVATCDKCKVERKHYRVSGRTAYACDHCGHHVYPLAGTIFEKSSTSLKLWFHAMFQMGSTKCGISAKQIQRETGVTYKTAWRMFRQVRSLMGEEISLEGSTVEVDETMCGGVQKCGAGRKPRDNKTIVMGMAERKGRIVARCIPDTTAKTLKGKIHEYVLPGATVYTDEWGGYNTVGEHRQYRHRRIKHALKVYVMGDVHTNTVEGFWSLIKRGISGVHHSVSEK
jgi:transposase-like protein